MKASRFIHLVSLSLSQRSALSWSLQSSRRRSLKTYFSVGSPPPDWSIDEDDEESDRPRTDATSERDSVTPPPDWTVNDDATPSPANPIQKRTPKPTKIPRQPRNLGKASWLDRNSEFIGESRKDAIPREAQQTNRNNSPGNKATSFRQDFRGTRVFVQGLPQHTSWQDLKDHFRIAGEVVFASVSSDRSTGESKGHGIVQFETTDMAQNAIRIMRDHPLDGYDLYVREDVQEKPGREPGMPKGPTPPTKWKCANEENTVYLTEDELASVRALIKARDDARRRKKYDASDQMREDLKQQYGVHIDDRLKMWWTVADGNNVPQSIQDIKGDGRWGQRAAWRQIPTTPENDACVNPDLVNGLLKQRDIARREKDFSTADALLEEARTCPDGDLSLRIHDESRTWRIWSDEPPPRPVWHDQGPAEQCLAIVREHAPHKIGEIEEVLSGFPGREYQVLKKLKNRYL